MRLVESQKKSCTREVFTYTGRFLNGDWSSYGINDTLINVFDTPGNVKFTIIKIKVKIVSNRDAQSKPQKQFFKPCLNEFNIEIRIF